MFLLDPEAVFPRKCFSQQISVLDQRNWQPHLIFCWILTCFPCVEGVSESCSLDLIVEAVSCVVELDCAVCLQSVTGKKRAFKCQGTAFI